MKEKYKIKGEPSYMDREYKVSISYKEFCDFEKYFASIKEWDYQLLELNYDFEMMICTVKERIWFVR